MGMQLFPVFRVMRTLRLSGTLCSCLLSNAAALGDRIKFLETPISLILLRKINEIGVSRKYLRLCKTYCAAYSGERKF